MMRENVVMIEEGYLITYKDKSCSFIRKSKLQNENGYIFSGDIEQQNPKKDSVLVPEGVDKEIAIKSFGSGDKTVMIGDIKIAEPIFKSPDHPKWYEICHYDKTSETHKILARIQVDLIQDTVKPITPESLPDVTGIQCDRCKIKLSDIHHDIKLVTEHLTNCGGNFVKK